MKTTTLSQLVISIFKVEHRPLSVPVIQDILKIKNLVPNKTTLYRLLEKLKQENLIEEVLLDSRTTFYELKTHGHHHFSCTDCETVECIEDKDLEGQIKTLEQELKNRGLQIESHHFSLAGKCQSCA